MCSSLENSSVFAVESRSVHCRPHKISRQVDFTRVNDGNNVDNEDLDRRRQMYDRLLKTVHRTSETELI